MGLHFLASAPLGGLPLPSPATQSCQPFLLSDQSCGPIDTQLQELQISPLARSLTHWHTSMTHFLEENGGPFSGLPPPGWGLAQAPQHSKLLAICSSGSELLATPHSAPGAPDLSIGVLTYPLTHFHDPLFGRKWVPTFWPQPQARAAWPPSPALKVANHFLWWK